MGHNVRYSGRLTPKNPLSDQEKAFFKELQDDDDNYDLLYALEYKNGFFKVNDENEKIYVDRFYSCIEKYVAKLKEGGNDLIDGSYLLSCSEYGIDDEAIILLYKKGDFIQKGIVDLVEQFIKIEC
jgi:hypothetical protein